MNKHFYVSPEMEEINLNLEQSILVMSGFDPNNYTEDYGNDGEQDL